jgi:hypothetical protein
MNPWAKRSIVAVIFGLIIFGGARCVSFLSDDSLRASEQLNSSVKNK